MRTASLFTLLGWVAACGPGAAVDSDVEPAPTPTPCFVTFSDERPADGEQEFYYRSALSWEFSDRDDSATVQLVDWGGSPVSGSGEWVNEILVWTPDAPLVPSTAYTWTVTHCDGAAERSGTFATSDVGAPIDPGLLQDATFALDLTTGTWVQPAGIGALLGSQLEIDLLIAFAPQAGAPQSGELEVLAAFGDDDVDLPTQDPCHSTFDLVTEFEDNPSFDVGPAPLELVIQGLDITFDDVRVSGSFEPNGEAIQIAAMESLLDTRTGFPGQPTNPSATCDPAQFGISCVPCPDGVLACLDVLVTDITAQRVPDLTLVPRDPATIAADPSCQ